MSNSGSKPAITKLRLGYYDDFTTLPITYMFEAMVKSAVLRRGSVADLRAAMLRDEFEIVLLPTVEALKIPNSVIIGCSAVSAVGASRLFMLYSKVAPGEIKRVLVDSDDLGSTALAQILFARKMMTRPEFVRSETPLDPQQYDFGANDGFDAYLAVGRNCHLIRRDAFIFTWDLTLAWYEYCKLPFVVNCWVGKRGLKLGKLEREMQDVARRNENVDDITKKAGMQMSNVSQSSVRAIYEKALTASFDSNTLAAIRKFGQELVQGRILAVQPATLHVEPTLTARR